MRQHRPHIFLFNDERFQRFNLQRGQRLFCFDHPIQNRLIGTFTGVIEGQKLTCGYSAPFGGIDFVRNDEAATAVTDLIEAVRAAADAEGVRNIRIKGRPCYYGANETATMFALLGNGALAEACELSLGLEVWRYGSPDDYVASLRPSIARQLRKAKAADMYFDMVETAADWADCFALLVETRRRRGAEMKITLDYVLRLRAAFGQRIAMYRLTKDHRLAAAALVYRTRSDVDHVVAWGDDILFRKDRVMNLMAYHLVCEAISGGIRIIDLGISSVNGVPDDGLIQFKRNIGASTGLRIDFSLETR